MKNYKAIWFDMDGTIVDLYGVEGWDPKLRAEDPTPYTEAKPLLNMQALARVLNRLNRNGFEINIISWTSKGGSPEYNEAVANAKREWLNKHLASVQFTHIDIVEYGTPKEAGRYGILFDDDKNNRTSWSEAEFWNRAFNENNIIPILRGTGAA